MDALDFPDMGLLAPARGFSASALQALAVFNNHFVLRCSEHFAARLEALAVPAGERIQAAFRLALQRPASAEEIAGFTALAAEHGLPAVCRVIFNSNEFLFVD